MEDMCPRLTDLARREGGSCDYGHPPHTARVGRDEGRPMSDLYNNTTGELLGQLTEADLQVLVDALEEESTQDRDYFVDAATIEVIADGRATEHLVALLRKALGSTHGVEIRWERR